MNFQVLLAISQIIVAVGLIMAAVGGFGSYYFQSKIDQENVINAIPVVDLCRRGIVVTRVTDKQLHFDIPYCAGKNANAFNVKLKTAIILKSENGYKTLANFDDEFPDGITLTYETGKSIQYSLQPMGYESIENMYIGVRGSYSNESKKSIFTVFDVYKFSQISQTWVRTLGNEDANVRKYFGTLKE